MKPSKSCLRLYFIASHSSFASVRRIMSLGGRIQVPESHLQELCALICAVSGLDLELPEYQETPFITNSHYNTATKDNFRELPEILHSYVYSFDIAPGKTVPDVEFHTPVRGYGPTNRILAANLIDWMEKRGRGMYAGEYLGMLEHLSQDGRLRYGKGAQTYISALIKHDGELDVTSYLGPAVVDTSQGVPRRRRGTHRRSDGR
ncbi:hypothetical protein PENCOP_c012G04148 [Penicillium coprophilum]|uniref:Uncharacterized protein n=1 Tax=Penicillium coprophilum TaxID=36646 RepID=A0A1V6UC39_9EURO|nr:hypothetical protein PENCOP_c012G04148 [Penicillium coprophilum]